MTLTNARKVGPLIVALDTIKPNDIFATGLIGGKLPDDVVNAMLQSGVSYIRAQLRDLGVDPV